MVKKCRAGKAGKVDLELGTFQDTFGNRTKSRPQNILVIILGLAVTASCRDGVTHQSLLKSPSKTAAVSTFYAPDIGDEKVCEIKAQGVLDVDYGLMANVFNPQAKSAQGQGMTNHRFEVQTELHSRVLAKEEGNFVLAVRLRNHHAVIDHDEEQRTAAFETPFLIHMNGNGDIVKYEFARMFPKDVRVRVRGLVESLQVVGPESADAVSWEATEHTAQGREVVVYEVQQQSSNERVLRRTLLSSTDSSHFWDRSSRARRSNRITHSDGTVVWAADGSGLLRYTVNETMNGRLGNQILDKQQSAMNVMCRSDAVHSLPATLAAARESLKDDTFIKTAFYRIPAERFEKIKALRFDDMVTRFDADFTAGLRADAVANTKYWLRMHPRSSREFIDRLTDMTLTRESRERIAHGFTAVAAAGHTEAQEALTDVISSADIDPDIRDLAVRGTLNLQRPERALVAAVWQYRESLPEPKNAHERALQSMTTAIYGSLGNVEFGNREISEEVVENLSLYLIAARSVQDKVDVLSALGNVGDPELTLPHSESYFYSDDWQLRGYAFKTFQMAEGDGAFEAFASYFEAETDGYARRIAAEVATVMPFSTTQNEWMSKQVFSETDGTILTKYARVLGDNLTRLPKNETVLRQMLETIDDRSVRKTIYRYIGPASTGGAK